MFYLSELSVRDFASFRDVHGFHFVEGLNLIQGSGGSGKTNLVRALEFALFGKTRDRSTPSARTYARSGV